MFGIKYNKNNEIQTLLYRLFLNERMFSLEQWFPVWSNLNFQGEFENSYYSIFFRNFLLHIFFRKGLMLWSKSRCNRYKIKIKWKKKVSFYSIFKNSHLKFHNTNIADRIIQIYIFLNDFFSYIKGENFSDYITQDYRILHNFVMFIEWAPCFCLLCNIWQEDTFTNDNIPILHRILSLIIPILHGISKTHCLEIFNLKYLKF